jgi:hypothetical protein
VGRHLGQAMVRLTGQSIGLFPHWRRWTDTAGVSEVLSADGGDVVVLSPAAERDPLAALGLLVPALARARHAFAHLLVDLGELPLRHPDTLACVDAIVTVAASGGVREEHLLAVERLLPSDRNLGVVLID